VKVAKPKQDMRFDVPVIGIATIHAMLILDVEHVLTSANAAGIAIIGRPRSRQRDA
jgi:DUF1009 family protein